MATINLYSKEQADALLANKANNADVYTKTEADTLLGTKANSADVYTKTEANTLLGAKANSADVYTKSETNSLLDGKENTIPKSVLTVPFKDLSAKGLTLAPMDNADDSHRVVRYGDMVVYNISVRITGTYTSASGVDDWVTLFDFIDFGKTNITPWVQSVRDAGGNSYLTINGNNLLMNQNRTYDAIILYQVVIMLGDANRGLTKQALPDPRTIINNQR